MKLDAATQKSLHDIRARAHAHLADKLLPFWAEHTWDEGHRGWIGTANVSTIPRSR